MNKKEIEGLLELINHGEDRFYVGEDPGGILWMQHQYDGIDSKTGEPRLCKGAKWRLSLHMTKGEIVQKALQAVLTNVEHEVREKFKYKNQAIFKPHYDIDKLVEVCEKGDSEEARE